MQKKWYAIVWAYGRDVVNQGNRADHIHQFKSKGARDAFVDAQERDGQQADPLPGGSPLVQRARRYAAQGLDWPVPVASGE